VSHDSSDIILISRLCVIFKNIWELFRQQWSEIQSNAYPEFWAIGCSNPPSAHSALTHRGRWACSIRSYFCQSLASKDSLGWSRGTVGFYIPRTAWTNPQSPLSCCLRNASACQQRSATISERIIKVAPSMVVDDRNFTQMMWSDNWTVDPEINPLKMSHGNWGNQILSNRLMTWLILNPHVLENNIALIYDLVP